MSKPKNSRKLCRRCGNKRAVFVYRGRARHDDHHDLCPRCFRAELDRLRATLVASAA
jgi:hypothetical protein